MKRQSFMLGTLLLLSSSLFAESPDSVVKALTTAANNFGVNSLNGNLSRDQQNASLTAWESALSQAKKFVIDNSKNLVGVKDSDIINGMSAVEKASMDLINAIKIIRGLKGQNDLTKQKSHLTTIKDTLIKNTNKLGLAKMTLSKKQDAKNVVISAGRFLEGMIDRINSEVQDRIRIASTPTRSIVDPTIPKDMPPVYQGK